MGRKKEAIDSYLKATVLHPGFRDAHYNMGLALNDLEMKLEAIMSFRKAI